MRERDGTSDKDNYVHSLFCNETKAMSFAREQASAINPEMMISAREGKILQTLVRTIGAKKVVEVGAFTGYSGLWFLEGLKFSGGRFWTCELSPEHAEIAKTSFKKGGFESTSTVLQGPALETLEALSPEGPFDLVFIDADKGGYFDYLQWAEKNVRKGGLIIGDNTYLFGNVFVEPRPKDTTEKSWQSMRAFNSHLANSEKYTSILFPTLEGMTVAVKEF